jgi:predicted lipoprotein with Yx(FWY)xxD motif
MIRTGNGRRKWLAGVLAITASFALIAAACGDDDDNGDNGGATTSPTAAAQASPTRAAQPTAAATAAATPVGTSAAGGDTELLIGDTSLGKVLTDADGFTLYTFKNDTANSGASACNGGCASAWPPATVSGTPAAPAEATGDVGTITRDDGTMQATYNGLPLYRFANDTAPGQTNGEGVAGLWTVAKP